MPRFVALLRGVNVGKAKRVSMADFKVLLESLGYTGVATVLNSGNAVFTGPDRPSAQHAAAIAAALQQRLDVAVAVIVKSAAELGAIMAASPLAPAPSEHSSYLVAFAAEEAALRDLAPLEALAQEPERFVVSGVAAFLHCPAGLLQSKVAEQLLGKFGKRVTTRNWATVLKLAILARTVPDV